MTRPPTTVVIKVGSLITVNIVLGKWKPNSNLQLARKLVAAYKTCISKHTVEIVWFKAHSANTSAQNDDADRLAKAGATGTYQVANSPLDLGGEDLWDSLVGWKAGLS